MGANGSKPETKVFTPDTPIDFSATFLSHLESSPEVCPQKIFDFEDCRNQIDKQQTIILTFSYVVGFLPSSIYREIHSR